MTEAVLDTNGNSTGYVIEPVVIAPAMSGQTMGFGDIASIGLSVGKQLNPFANIFNAATGGMLDKGLDAVASITSPLVTNTYNTLSGALSSPVDLLATIKPELQGLVDTIKEDPELASALNDAMVKDPTFLPGLIRMSSSTDGTAFLSSVEEGLQNPEVRANLTLGLQNLAEREDIDFSDFEEFANSATQYDMAKPEESRARVINAHLNMGLTEENAEETMAAGRDGFWKDILQNPERLGGWIGNMLEDMGLPAGFAESIASFIPGMINMIGGAPEFIKDWMGPEYQEYYSENVVPAAQGAMEAGRSNMTLAMNY